MSIRNILSTISTIRSVFDENGNYLPAGNYYYHIKNFRNNVFEGDIKFEGGCGKFVFNPQSLVKMMAVGQSKLATYAGLCNEPGMPNYPFPTNDPNNPGVIPLHCLPLRSRYVVNYYNPNRFSIRNQIRRNEVVEPEPEPEPEPENCPICIERISDNNRKTLICCHHFHKNCINTWLITNNTCPVCRKVQSERSLFQESPQNTIVRGRSSNWRRSIPNY